MINIVCVGKIKENYLSEMINDYYKRVNKYHNVNIIELKDSNIKDEGDLILKNLKGFIVTMEIDLIFKIAAVGIIVSILNQVLVRSGREEQATMTSLAGLVVVLMIVVQRIAELFDLVKTLFRF